ncbi:ABC transporter permease subunit [Deinococcus detaillensis]|uniref:ABC transporter permease subunit n=1 Tax=Deinococcus detaillensis TaxID=2592048 RepID=A0A553UUG3_9DEIO|nr:ABC transporter permease subunit [Deinococcus detaillensis]TSA83848.1 ABC transporter permease subunit [Deinococcus detaillensis]
MTPLSDQPLPNQPLPEPAAPHPPAELPQVDVRGSVSGTAAIELQDVSLRLGGREVLSGVNLEVRRGEFLAIIGPSGGGKSTLLRIVSGLLRADSGEVAVRGRPAYVFQDDRLLPWRSALRNVSLPCELGSGGVLTPGEALKLVGMAAYGDYLPAQLSGGMRARVGLARALAQSGDILLLDEPFAALDALVRERFNDELRHLHEKTGQTTLMVTHSIREAVLLADRVAVLRGGKIVALLETRGQGRLSAYTEGTEAQLRSLLGSGDSTHNWSPPPAERSKSEWLPVLALALGLLIWQALAVRIDADYLLPTPLRVWQVFWQNRADLLSQLGYTAAVALLGALLGSAFGVLIGYPMARLRWLERFLSPLLIASQSTPTVVLAPVLLLWLGFGILPGILVSALTAFYPVLVSTLVGVREVDRTYQELFSTLRATPLQRLLHLELPGALPVLLGGLRLSLSLALIGAVVWEFTSNQRGLGFAINQARQSYQTPRVFAAIALLVLLGVALYSVVAWLERREQRRRGR